jgi:uncharacterized protein YndB with AHSA1/START domain
MAEKKRIQFRETIAAPVEVVWETMLGAESYRKWTTAFADGSYFDGSWSEGSRIRFLSPSGDGLVAEIAENRVHEFLSIRHLGFVFKGVEDTDSEAVRAWAPAYENYTFSAVPGGTEIVVDQDVTADFEQCMEQTWPNALGLLKLMCEGSPA